MIYLLVHVNLENTWVTGLVETVTVQTLIEFNCMVNYISSTFSFTPFDVKLQLFNTYCMPLYGSVLWDLSNKNVRNFIHSGVKL